VAKAKKSKEEWKTYGNVFDEFTNRNLKYLENQGHFEEVKQTLEVGKEANVFIAEKEDKSKVIVKIYRLENCNFNKMFDYIKADPRFNSLKPRRREIIFAWVLREYRNLLVARQAGCSVPTPIINKHNILLEEFIGDDVPAQKIKDVIFASDSEVEKCFKNIIKEVKLLWRKAEIVHGDLSEFNILYHKKKPIFIDFSQSTSIKDYHAKDYLERDLKNLVRFFGKRGLDLDLDKLMNSMLG
jgi:RIO kinase 1